MKTHWYHTKRNFDHTKYGEGPHGPSLTVPGEALSINEIMERYTRTGTAPIREAEYFDVEDIDYINQYYAPHALDLTDMDGLTNHIDRLQAALAKAKQNKETEPPKVEPAQQSASEA